MSVESETKSLRPFCIAEKKGYTPFDNMFGEETFFSASHLPALLLYQVQEYLLYLNNNASVIRLYITITSAAISED